MEIPAIFQRPFEVLSKPNAMTWDRLYTSPAGRDEALIEVGAILAAAVALQALFGLIDGVMLRALIFGIVGAALIIGMAFGMAIAVDRIAPFFGALPAGDNGQRLFAFATVPVAAATLLGSVLSVVSPALAPNLLFLGVAYGAYHFYLAAPAWYGVPDDRRWPMTGAVYGIWVVGLYSINCVIYAILF